MDWNRDGKIDAHDTTLYHMLINNDSASNSGVSGSCARRSYAASGKSTPTQVPAARIDSDVVVWVIAVTAIAILFFFA